MDISKLSCVEFTEKLGSRAPVPGGGGAAALTAAVGTALGVMVCDLTVGKKKYAAVEEELKTLREQAEDLRRQLISCIDEDAEAFEPLSKAYGIPKDDPGRDEIMEACLKGAAATPYKIMELTCQVIDLHRVFAEKGSVLVISDAATGAAICRGALRSAALNVKANTMYMKDRSYAEDLNARVEAMLRKYLPAADEIFDSVYSKM